MSLDRRRPVVVLIHGILTSQTHPGWIDRLGHLLWLVQPGVEVVKRRYSAGPFPRWNWFVKNPRLGQALAEELRPYGEDGAEFYFVTHSNGAHIAIETIRRLARAGFRAERAIFIGAAISAHLEKSGVERLLEAGALGAAFAYCSPEDLALKLRATWPYGHLGRLGFHQRGRPVEIADDERYHPAFALTRWFAGYGHGGYFHPSHEPRVFEQIRADLFAS